MPAGSGRVEQWESCPSAKSNRSFIRFQTTKPGGPAATGRGGGRERTAEMVERNLGLKEKGAQFGSDRLDQKDKVVG